MLDLDSEILMRMAYMYSPVILVHTDEKFLPKPVEAMIDNALLKCYTPCESVVCENLTVEELIAYKSDGLFLEYKKGVLPEEIQKKYPNKVYARFVNDKEFLFLQFHFFYVYNNWVNRHQGDWELIQIAFICCPIESILSGEVKPTFVTYSQHAVGVKVPWCNIQVHDCSHPIVYVGLGSHANYYRPGVYFRLIGFEHTGRREIDYSLNLLECSRDNEWLSFSGKWGKKGEGFFYDDGPTGPKFKLMWDQPFLWSNGEIYDTGKAINPIMRVLKNLFLDINFEGWTSQDWLRFVHKKT